MVFAKIGTPDMWAAQGKPSLSIFGRETALEQMVFFGISVKIEANFQGDSWEVRFYANDTVEIHEIRKENWEHQ